MITIVIPLYNKADTIQRAIDSVLLQSETDFELIVVNNGSSDGGEKVAEGVTDPRVRVVHQDNRGVSAARNRGIEEARGEWVAFLDADDEWMPTFLATMKGLRCKYPDCAVCATAYRRCDDSGAMSDIRLSSIPDRRDFVMDNYFEVAATSDPPFCSISVMASRKALQEVGCFPEGVYQGEDLLTWARLATRNKIAYCVEPQSIFYTGDNYGNGIPKRIPPEDDVVGRELEKLYRDNREMESLPLYIARWHKMRASIFLRLPSHSQQCRNEIALTRKWNPRSKKLNLYHCLLLIPYPLRMNILKNLL